MRLVGVERIRVGTYIKILIPQIEMVGFFVVDRTGTRCVSLAMETGPGVLNHYVNDVRSDVDAFAAESTFCTHSGSGPLGKWSFSTWLGCVRTQPDTQIRVPLYTTEVTGK